MTFAAADPVSSGRPYPVLLIGDKKPISIDDFVGTGLTMTIQCDHRSHLVAGDGSLHGDHVRFHEKDSGGGKDVRAWKVTTRDGSEFFAESSTAHH